VLRHDLEKHPVKWHKQGSDAAEIRITTSIGVTTVVPGEVDPIAVIARADAALYQAKKLGRNRVCVALSESLSDSATRV
jgi:diguanylate cyclase (GGDEF)-like protein